MMENFNNLRRFFDEFKNLTFWQRLFSWNKIRALSYAAYQDLVLLDEQVKKNQSELETFRRERDLLLQDRNSVQSQLADMKEGFGKLDMKLQHLDLEAKRTQLEKQDLQRKLSLAEQREEQRKKEHDQSVNQFLTLKQSAEKEKLEIKEKALRELQTRNELMKETWRRHEGAVQSVIKDICQRHAIEYVEEVPFRGKPDGVIRICDELIVFDAKSPASEEDLTNFNTYLRSQAEAAGKYANHDGVRKEIYLVVPSNTLEVLKSRRFDLGNYTVTVITIDALEPVIESLKKLEIYEFAEQLSPEDRQSICRIVGSYIYMTKRRIQVDQDFNSHALELLSRTNREIPELMQEEIAKHEKAMKINPPVDRRSKAISQEALEKTQAQQSGQVRVFEMEEELGLVVSG
jgi:hypothetical protein